MELAATRINLRVGGNIMKFKSNNRKYKVIPDTSGAGVMIYPANLLLQLKADFLLFPLLKKLGVI